MSIDFSAEPIKTIFFSQPMGPGGKVGRRHFPLKKNIPSDNAMNKNRKKVAIVPDKEVRLG